MSTRGAVAWGTLEHWTGVYNHYDSYPSGLGQEVWDKLQKMGAASLVAALQNSRGWADFLKGGQCPYCGRSAAPSSVCGIVTPFDRLIEIRKEGVGCLSRWERDLFETRTNPEAYVTAQKNLRGEFWNKSNWQDTPNGRFDFGYEKETQAGLLACYSYAVTGFPDPHGVFHTHVEGPIDESRMTETSADPLFVEWVYILDIEANALHVLGNGCRGRVRPGLRMIGTAGDADGYNKDYAHYHVASVPFSAEKFPRIPSPYPEEEEE